ncbi:MAG: hypothetical protein L6Q92_13185 [Phycisphaerae bacterium]|nr:hypothetical protein [Phycisphaerae bacterium]
MKLDSVSRRTAMSFGIVAGLVVLGLVTLWWNRVQVASMIAEMNATSAQAMRASSELRERCVPADERARIAALEKDMADRFRDAKNPALVVAGLSETCRRFHTTVHEIVPVPSDRPGNPHAKAARRYRLIVSGTYRQLAELLDGCATQRLPARIIELQIEPAAGDPARPLRAQVIVECFEPAIARKAGAA